MKKLLIALLITMPAFLFATSNIGSNYGINTLSDALKNKLNFSKGSKIIISGTFTIDVDYSFIGNDIDMASGSITVTAPNTITSFYDSHIYCSTGMWVGISTYGQITVSECVIEDAISFRSLAKWRKSKYKCSVQQYTSIDAQTFKLPRNRHFAKLLLGDGTVKLVET